MPTTNLRARPLRLPPPLSGNVFPVAAGYDLRDHALGYPETFRQFPLEHPRPVRSNELHVSLGEFRPAVVSSTRNTLGVRLRSVTAAPRNSLGVGARSVTLSPRQSFGVQPGTAAVPGGEASLSLCVQCVIQGRPQEQVVRAHTRRVVASVADKKARRDRADQQLVGESVCHDGRPLLRRFELPVSLSASGAHPEPAPATLTDLLPESFFERSWARRHSNKYSVWKDIR